MLSGLRVWESGFTVSGVGKYHPRHIWTPKTKAVGTSEESKGLLRLLKHFQFGALNPKPHISQARGNPLIS